jgi:polysaccharide export outer membrane protein
MNKTLTILGFTIFLLILLTNISGHGQTTAIHPDSAPSTLASQEPFHSASTNIILESGDLLEVSVAGAPEYHYEVRVTSTGDASLPMLGNLKIAGLSTPQAETAIAQRLQQRGFFNDPQVSVFVKEYAAAGISVLGEVQKPGIYPLPGNRTLLDAISAGGGVTPRAGKTVTITHRDGKDRPETIPLSQGNGQMTNVAVQPGDTIVVSKAGMVYVVGDVKEPTGIVLDNPHLTVLQAVAMAHGTNPTASLKGATLIHKTTGDTPQQQTPVPLNNILTAQSPDIELHADDIVFIPNSRAKTIRLRTFEALVQTATGIAIWGRY